MIQLLFQLTEEDRNYLSFLKPLLSGKANVALNISTPVTIHEICIRAKEKGTTRVITTSQTILKLLLEGKKGTIDEYAGSIFHKVGIDFLILDPLEHLVTKSWGKFIFQRYLSKFLMAADWLDLPKFKWYLFSPDKEKELSDRFSKASLISADIETRVGDEDRVITCISFTAIFFNSAYKNYTTLTIVVPFLDMFSIQFARNILSLEIPKVFQNGKYDIAYLLRYNSIPSNYILDTINLFHSWYSELPKDLGFITAFLIRDWIYHKNDNDTSDLEKHYEYNAKDSFTTALDALVLISEMPDWAWSNYYQEFPLVFPCILAEMTGIRSDEDRRKEVKAFLATKLELDLAKIRVSVNNPYYNPSSPVQTAELFKALGCGDLTGTGKIPSDKAKSRHPLNKRILGPIEKYKQDRKAHGTYFKDEVCWQGRIYYSINPHATDTGRMASKESSYWCGLQIQNITRDNTNPEAKVKDIFVSDDGFYFGEGDYSQAETWGTAYLSGDPTLLKVINDKSKDFHSYNAAAFFGLNYSDICLSILDEGINEYEHKRLDLKIIDIAKRNNHGSNYNMGASVLLDTMGIENVIRAGKLLKLPSSFSLLNTTQYILNTFEKTYPVIKGPWYDKVKSDVKGSGFLISPFNWHRYCFSDPSKSKLALNSYVAHPPQNLNTGFLNRAWLRVFYEVWMPNFHNFKLCAQIHDCIFFQYRIGHEYLAWQVKKIMEEINVDVKDSFGTVRNLRVPVDLKGGAGRWSELKKMKKSVSPIIV